MFSDRLVLDVAENEAATGDLEVWSPFVSYALWLMLNCRPVCALIGKGLQQIL